MARRGRKRQTTSIGVARKRCKGKKGGALKKCMKNVMKGGKSGVTKRRKRRSRRRKRR